MAKTLTRKEYINDLRGHLQGQIRKLAANKKPKNLKEWIEFNQEETKKHKDSLAAKGTTVDMARGPK
jgi:phage terminase large subunit